MCNNTKRLNERTYKEHHELVMHGKDAFLETASLKAGERQSDVYDDHSNS